MILLIIVFLIIIVIDLPVLLKTHQKRRVVLLYSFLMGVGLMMGILLRLDKAPTSPTLIIENIIDSIKQVMKVG